MDEATSALNAESEARILHAIDMLRSTTTVLLITHRVAPLRHTDGVYVLHDGILWLQPAADV